MIATLTYTKNEEQLTLTLECGPMEELVSKELKGQASFRKDLEQHLAKSYGTYDETLTLALCAEEDLDLQVSVAYEGEPPDPDDLEFD